ncbi:MAG: phage antirepressor Ant [Oscillibacter sp.]|jgi:anti-repressor protein|nr:phage antirepressor Ant [Oscillibacter sp.]
MNELIKITYQDDRPAVSARDLHEYLDVGSEYAHWFKRMCEYGFTEGQDFSSFLTESTGGRPAQDAILTLDMAKEICMLQRNEKGKQARLYFLQLEKDWNSPEKVMARALRIADRRIKALETENEVQRQAIADFEPKRQYLDTILNSTGALAVTQIAADYGISAKKLNRILHEEGIQRKVNGQWILYREHMGKGYTKSATIPITHEDGTPDAKLHTYFTQRGRVLIHNILTARGILAVMDRTA